MSRDYLTRELLLTILAMDSYNRDYGASILISGDRLGNVRIKTRDRVGV